MRKLVWILPYTTSPIPAEYHPRLIANLTAQKPTDLAGLRRVATETARELYPKRAIQALVSGQHGTHFAIALQDLN